ncbi:three component ABC system middle component [Bordetella bronchiseptica]|uniref:three component ABC system middle component n=1 Tax=Bordetella bronchiseptica TaxID=518 RepID=UPI000F669564|nr:three component ABC system middle component [Bordetella bronchiseptica]
MIKARDIFAETNPAFCCAVFSRFCSAYQEAQLAGQYPTSALVYLIVPISISEEFAATFVGCNKDTGLSVWLSRHPEVTVDISKKVNLTLEITTNAIRFGCIAGKLRLTSNGDLESLLESMPTTVSGGIAAGALKRARLLGIWMAAMGSPRAVFEAFGVSV